ncbi:hypothetical protein M514_20210 [Trichuris suis]|uniref:EGF-like domain-containing protein n=1 Tax=Trichuris suis TaxID=68888 RepID=A0A085NDI7_9BILA|nr:hypothetical protein M514_20210 [Trichuris suis]
MGIAVGDYIFYPFLENLTPLTQCSTMTPEGRTIGFLWPTGMKTLCSSDKALEHIWSQTKSTTKRSTDEQVFDVVKPERRRRQGRYEQLVNGYFIVKINCTETGEEYSVAYKQLESENISVIRHVVDNKVIVKPDLTLFNNFTDLEHSSKENFGPGERIIVLLDHNKLYYVHESKLEEFSRMRLRTGVHLTTPWIAYFSLCSYSNYMKYCAQTIVNDIKRSDIRRDVTFTAYGCSRCRGGLAGLHCSIDLDECGLHTELVLQVPLYTLAAHHTAAPAHWFFRPRYQNGINNCSIHSKCENTLGSYKCICHDGWRGVYCDEDIDECTSSPCQNQGECTNTDGSFKCKCSAYFTGQTCETEIDACKSLECVHGFCTGKGSNALCQCYGRWTGSKCNEAMPSTYWHTIFIVIIAIPCCHSYPELNSYDKNDCFYYFWRHEHRIDFPMAVVDGSYVLVPYAKYFTPLTLCGRMTPEGRTIGFLWPTGMKTLCSSDKALEHIWSQTKSTSNTSTDERLFSIVRPERRRVQRGMYELLVNGYVIVKINCTQTGNECNVAYKQLESENISVIRHVVEGNVVVKPDLALFYNFTDLEHSSKQYLGAGERIIVILSNDKLYYIHESKLEEFIEMCRRAHIPRIRGWLSYHSMCSYSNYMKYCADKPAYDIRPRSVTVPVYGCRRCRQGLVGLHCHTDVDECAQRNAVRGYYTTFTIDTSEGNVTSSYWWIRFTYQNGINDCSIHSKCENTFGSYKCICHDGWRGIHCDEDDDECNTAQQICGGMTDRCENIAGSYKYIEECKNNPCRHGGLCMETYGSYTCQCPPGWNGHNCEKDIDECTSSPCQNQGECTNTDGSFKCKCSAYFTGQTCETEIDACKSLECVHGFCTGKGSNALCQCYGRWTGSKCNEAVNMCERENTCMSGSTCKIDALMNFTCQCAKGFTGRNCEKDENDCESNPCVNGWCVDLVGGYKCICRRGMEGDDCSKSENRCSRFDCLRGSCLLHNGMPYCKCDEDHHGVHCEIEMDRCMSSPCSEAATCVNDLKNKGYICICPEGYKGVHCQQSTFCPNYYRNAPVIAPSVRGKVHKIIITFIQKRAESILPLHVLRALRLFLRRNIVTCTATCALNLTLRVFSLLNASQFLEKTFCAKETCFNNGTCLQSDSPLGYRCLCSNKSTGKRCEMLLTSTAQTNYAKGSTFSLISVVWAVTSTLWVSLARIWHHYPRRSNY